MFDEVVRLKVKLNNPLMFGRILRTTIWLGVLLVSVGISQAQTYQEGKILKWDTEPYSQSAHIVRNAVVYYIQVDNTALYHIRESEIRLWLKKNRN